MKKKIVLLLLIILLPLSVKAYSCSYTERANLKKIASNVTTSYEFIEDNDTVKFNVTLTNLNSDLYIVDSITGYTYYYNGNNEITLYGYEPGTSIQYKIYTTKTDCYKNYMMIKYVNLPYYNKYYKDELCTGKNYSICGKWQKVSLSYDDFVKKINELNVEKNNKGTIEDNPSLFDVISNFIFNYYFYIMAGFIIIMIPIEIIKRKRNSFDF